MICKNSIKKDLKWISQICFCMLPVNICSVESSKGIFWLKFDIPLVILQLFFYIHLRAISGGHFELNTKQLKYQYLIILLLESLGLAQSLFKLLIWFVFGQIWSKWAIVRETNTRVAGQQTTTIDVSVVKSILLIFQEIFLCSKIHILYFTLFVLGPKKLVLNTPSKVLCENVFNTILKYYIHRVCLSYDCVP